MFKLSISLWRATKIKWAHSVWTVSLDAFFWWAFCLSGSTRFPSFPFVPYSFLPSSLEGPPHAINFCLLWITLATPSACVGPNSLVTPLHNLPVQCQYIPARWWLKGWQWYYNSTESSSTITTSRGEQDAPVHNISLRLQDVASHQVAPGSDLLCFQEAPLDALVQRFHDVPCTCMCLQFKENYVHDLLSAYMTQLCFLKLSRKCCLQYSTVYFLGFWLHGTFEHGHIYIMLKPSTQYLPFLPNFTQVAHVSMALHSTDMHW